MRLPITIALLAALWAAPASAWNSFGHMEVAAVAWAKMTTEAQTRAGELLKLNPMYEAWTMDVEPQDRARIAFILASVWADTIKGARDYQNDGAAGGNRPPRGPEASQNIGYVDHLRHKYWHFTDIPFSTDGSALEEPATPNIQTQIATLRSALTASATSDDVKSYDLVWLIHLVGDAHQPLHATARFTRHYPHGDEGGNLVSIRCDSGCSKQNLHAFWDDLPGPSTAGPGVAAEAAASLPEPTRKLAAIANEKEWLSESFELAKAVVYASPVSDGPEPITLTEEYKTKARELMKRQVALAGVRLAELLNVALK